MTAVTHTISVGGSGDLAVGVREDLEDVIYRVAAEATPFISNIGKAKATNILHEWQTETLDTPDATNCQLEGDDITSFSAQTASVRVGNRCQITRKTFIVSRTTEKVDKAGRASEIARQKVLKGLAGKRDIEKRFIGNFASNAESGSTPRRAGGALAWLTSNVSSGSGATAGGFSSGDVAAAGNGTQRTFTESLVKTVLSSAFSNGGRPTQAYMGPSHKQLFSAFTGIASIRKDASGDKMATIIGAADVYVSDFGNLALIPHPYGLTRDCLLADPDMFAYAPLEGWSSEELAKTGDARKFMLVTEATLVCRNEQAHAVIRDLT